jgi:hypothetical protein
MDSAFLHYLDPSPAEEPEEVDGAVADVFLLEDRYSRHKFQGIMPDTGAAKYSTVGYDQYLALRREDPKVSLDSSRADEATIKFGKGPHSSSKGTTTIATPLGDITFHVIDASTPFLFSITDMDALGVFLRNTTNELVQRRPDGTEIVIPVTRK